MVRNYTRINQCVYALLDPRKPGIYKYGNTEFNHEPFYIGKGSEERPYRHIKAVKYNWKSLSYRQNKEKTATISEIIQSGCDPIVKIIVKNLNSLDATNLERALIGIIGRSCLNSGLLVNKTEGGEGEPFSLDVRLKMSRNHADFRGEKNPFFGKKHPPEVIEKIASKLRGRRYPNAKRAQTISDEHKQRIREGLLRYYANKKQENSEGNG